MDKHFEQNSELSRRELLKSTAAAGLALTAGVGGDIPKHRRGSGR